MISKNLFCYSMRWLYDVQRKIINEICDEAKVMAEEYRIIIEDNREQMNYGKDMHKNRTGRLLHGRCVI
jgi:hypothetical protein